MKSVRRFAHRIIASAQGSFSTLVTTKAISRSFNQRHSLRLRLMCAVMLGLGITWLTLGFLSTKNNVSAQEQQQQQPQQQQSPQPQPQQQQQQEPQQQQQQQPPPAQPSPTRRPGLEIHNSLPDNTNPSETTDMSRPRVIEEKKNGMGTSPFYFAVEKALAKREWKLATVCALNDPVSRRVLEDYGAMYVASLGVKPPTQCVFAGEFEVTLFQDDARFKSVTIGSIRIDLQPAAMDALIAARAEALKQGLDITPRGSDAARRGYGDTVRLWQSRFIPGLNYWQQRGRLTKEKVAWLRQLPLQDQVREVLELEKTGIFFSKDFSKSILYSIAAPGSSQHIAMLALDVVQFTNPRVRQILARHGWFQTVKSDFPHFTYLGVEEKDLPSLGLKKVPVGPQLFWIPDVEPMIDEIPKVKK